MPMRGMRIVLAALLAMAATGCATMGKPDPVALGMAQMMDGRRDTVASAAALADIRIDGLERLDAPFPSAFTATLRHTAPGDFTVDAFGPMGLLLFHYTATQHAWLLETPGQPAAGGPLAANGRTPATLLLDTLAHLLDGVLGVPMGEKPPRREKDGGWRTGRGRKTVRFRIEEGNLARVAFKRRGVGPVTITYHDYRPLAVGEGGVARDAPHRIELTLPRHRLSMTASVAEWSVQTRPGPAGMP